MSAPRKIWANVDLYDTFSGKGICGEWNHCDVGSADDTVYHHDDVVRELVEALKGLLHHEIAHVGPHAGARVIAARAALAKIAQHDS